LERWKERAATLSIEGGEDKKFHGRMEVLGAWGGLYFSNNMVYVVCLVLVECLEEGF